MARFKPIPSKKEEFDAFWDDLMTKVGLTPEQKQHIIEQSADFKVKTSEFQQACLEEATKGYTEGQPLEEFKANKLRNLNIIADTVNSLVE